MEPGGRTVNNSLTVDGRHCFIRQIFLPVIICPCRYPVDNNIELLTVTQ